ncbi:IS66 family transposase [Weissella paramesenteroides]|nr:IS66 family transposase [Weissella paramesenteroides]KAA8456827.1 IS66 family transposase [Weissella paramesenteroides]KAA8458360.1 IS66 family transposase [Weissella paramesenteroides]KAA8459652.1 IS66 family transposase [Weissella paramesenteroides]KAA8462662.1 IS66 family transposase [Weissella paramesenteroides]
MAYASKLQDNLNSFLYDGDIALSNNIAERSIRPITLGCKNWYFSTSEAGAQANDIMNSIVQSVRANHLNVKKYLLYLLETVTTIGRWGSTDRLEAYLPWHPEIIQQFAQI